MWERRRLTTLWAFTACYRDSFTLRYLLHWLIGPNELRSNDRAYLKVKSRNFLQRLRKTMKDMPGHPATHQIFLLGTRSKRLQRFHYSDCSVPYQQKHHPRTCEGHTANTQTEHKCFRYTQHIRGLWLIFGMKRKLHCVAYRNTANCELDRRGRRLIWHNVTEFTCRGWANQENPQSA
jgi:hypothetical protein